MINTGNAVADLLAVIIVAVLQVRVDWSHWKCGCGVLGDTDDLVRKGIVGPVPTDSKKSAALFKPAPGEILFVARPLSFFERLLYPIMKQ